MGRFASKGGERHMKQLLSAVRYLSQTTHYGILYKQEEIGDISHLITTHSKVKSETIPGHILFTDISHGGEKPMAGGCGFINENLYQFCAYRSPLTPLSSFEGEMIAAIREVTTGVSNHDILIWVGLIKEGEIPLLFCDNDAAVKIADSNHTAKRAKHIATRIAFLQEQIKERKVMMMHILTDGQLADFFTKPLNVAQFHRIRMLMVS